MRKTVLLLAGLWLGAAPAGASGASSCTATSGETAAALLELYTSEGCSSCPPADAWLATFRDNGLYPGKVVPLALHVDYWNYLGWEDPFAQEAFTRRQHHMARRHRANTVYTPQFLLNGGELRHWRLQGETAIRRAALAAPRADISLTLEQDGNRMNLIANARAQRAGGRADLFVVLYENHLSRRIGAGENAGRTLRHEFVARRWWGPVALDGDGTARFTRGLELDDDWKRGDLGVAAFVQDRDTGEVWQALARPACPG